MTGLADLYDGRASLNNVTTAAGYTDANTLRCLNGRRINFEIANAAIVYQLGVGPRGQEQWGTEVYLAPSLRSYDRTFDAVRIRDGAAGAHAQVTVEAIPASNLPASG